MFRVLTYLDKSSPLVVLSYVGVFSFVCGSAAFIAAGSYVVFHGGM